jgi:hypothetical protein
MKTSTAAAKATEWHASAVATWDEKASMATSTPSKTPMRLHRHCELTTNRIKVQPTQGALTKFLGRELTTTTQVDVCETEPLIEPRTNHITLQNSKK